jgi:hypothetical protein
METFTIKIDEAENVATIAEQAYIIAEYERTLRQISCWGRDHEPSIWAREVLRANSRELDS